MRKEVKGVRLLLGYLGLFLIFEGMADIFPLIVLVFYPSEALCWLDFVLPGAATSLLGFLLFFGLTVGRPRGHMVNHEDALLLVLIWIFAIVVGAFPFYLSNFPSLNNGNTAVALGFSFSESIFESTSGITATGLTVMPSYSFLTGIDSASALADGTLYPCAHVFLYHRAFQQFLGGIGLVLIVASVLSDRYNLKLYFAEGHNDKLMPNLSRSAKLIFSIYFGYIAIGTLSLWLAGMTPFDALCHATAALATGGFSTRYTSFLYFADGAVYSGNGLFPSNPIAMEIIAECLMLLGATNFVLHTFLLTGKWKAFFKDIEIKLAIWVIVIFSLASTVGSLYLSTGSSLDFATSLRYNVFGVISSMSTTGFTNFPDYVKLGEVAVYSSILLMIIGGGMGSTSGGIKQYRLALMLKDFYYSIRYHFSSDRLINPNPVYRLGDLKEEDPATADEAHNYTLIYLLFFLIGSMALMFLPSVSLDQSLYEFVSALSGTGITIIDYAAYKASEPLYCYNILLWTLDVGMLFGRLEILPMYYGFQQMVMGPIKLFSPRPKKAKEA